MKEYNKLADRETIKLFLVILLVFTLFLNWGGDNSWSRYSLTASIVDNQSLNIQSHSHTTVDKLTFRQNFIDLNKSRNSSTTVFRKSNKIYTDKAPFSSFIAIPAYVTGDIIAFSSSRQDIWARNGFSSDPVELSTETSLKMVLITFTTSAVFGAILIALIYRYLRKKVDSDIAFSTAVILGLGTPLFTYSSSYFGVVNAALFGFLALVAIEKSESTPDCKWPIASGIATSLAVSFEYYSGLFFITICSYLLTKKARKKIYYYLAGAFLGSIPLMIYHYMITGNPLLPAAFAPNLLTAGPLGRACTMFPNCFESSLGFMVHRPLRTANAFLRLLLSPSRGLLFYSPILLTAIPGILEIYRKNRAKLILFPGVTLLFFLMQSMRLNWMAGISFGPRYVIVSIAFLSLPLALGIERLLERGEIWKYIIFLLTVISVFNMLLGFSSWRGLNLDQETYTERFNSFEPIEDGLYKDRVSEFSERGPKSETMMSLTDRYKGLDITYRSPYGPDKLEIASLNERSIILSTQFLPILIMILGLTSLFYGRSRKLSYIGVLTAALILLLSINLADSYILGESYHRDDKLGGAVNSSMETIVYADEEKIPSISVVKTNPRDYIELNLSLNEEKEYSINLTGRERFILPSVKQGRNEISLKSDRCRVPSLNSNSTDNRCLSFAVEEIGSNTTSDFEEPVLNRFYGNKPDSEPWMSRRGEIIYASGPENDISALELEKISFLKESNPKISLNGRYIETVSTGEGDKKKIYFVNGSERNGINYLKIDSPECVVPSEETESDDDRCLSYRLKNITQSSDAEQGIYTEGWYRKEQKGRWMAADSMTLVRGREGKNALNLDLDVYEGFENNTVEIYIDGQNVRNVSIDRRKEIMLPLEKNRDLHDVRLVSRKGCIVPSKVNGSSEERCISIYLRDLSLESIEDNAKFQKGWFIEEATESGGYRWMTDKSFIIYNGTGQDLLSFSAKRYEGINSSLLVFSDGNKVGEYNESEIESGQVSLIGQPGLSTLRFESSEGCRVPSQVEEDSSDDRCLSFRFDELSIDSKSFGEGWYHEEGDEEFSYRWMGEDSETSFIAEGGKKTIEMEFKPYEYVSEPSLEIFINGKRAGKLNLEGPGRVRETLDVETEEGINELRLESQTGCAVPSNNERISSDSRCLSFQFNHIEIAD